MPARWYLALPLPAVALGVFVAARHGISVAAFIPNGVACVLGSTLVIAGRERRVTPRTIAFVALFVMLMTLLFVSEDGVRRWILVGPVRMNASQIVAPFLLWSIARVDRATAIGTTLTASLVHFVQPDAAQATAFGLAASIIFLRSHERLPTVVLGILSALVGAAITWARSDPLTPVDHVERIVHLAFSLSPLVGVAAILTLAILVVPFVRSGSPLGIAFDVYLAATMLVTESDRSTTLI